MDPVVIVQQLRKSYGAVVAVDDISFEVYQGEIFGMVGPNGAGKTTTIECLEGLRKPDAGKISVLGVDPQLDPDFLHLHTGMQLQHSNLPDRMKVWEALDLYSSFYPNAVDWELLLIQLGLEEKRDSFFSKLSGGQKQRLFIALSLLHDPELVFLDELTTGLDPQARHAIWDLVRDMRTKGKTILLTTHFMEEAERLCDRVAIIDHGCIVAMDTPSKLVSTLGAEESLSFVVSGELPAEVIQALSQAGRVELQPGRVVVHGNSHTGALAVDVVSTLSRMGVPFSDLCTVHTSLEDVFLNLTGVAMND